MARIACLLLICVAAGCGDVTRPGTGDGGPPDANPGAGAAREIVGGAGRVTGATYTLDVQVGHPVSQEPASGATYTIEGNAAVKP
jgi:hypothetical protein